MPSSPEENLEPILAVDDLEMTFSNGNGGLQTLSDISFTVSPQEFVCVLGPSGCGKTTLLRLLAGLLKPTGGKIIYEGNHVSAPPRGVGFVFQDSNLMPWRTVIENIMLPLELQQIPRTESLARSKKLIELVGLTGFEDVLPRDLSGGMAQRVAIARALVHDPDVLLLDEPFGALDALTRERMRSELLRIWNIECKTAVMVTHSINEAIFLADRVLVLGPRPAALRLNLKIEFARPRSTDLIHTPAFGSLAKQIRAAIA